MTYEEAAHVRDVAEILCMVDLAMASMTEEQLDALIELEIISPLAKQIVIDAQCSGIH